MTPAATIAAAQEQTTDIQVTVIPAALLDWGDADVPHCETGEEKFAWAMFLTGLDGVWTYEAE